MFSLKRLRLREQRRQPLQKFSQKATQSPAPKTSSTARTAGRSDRAERRFRRQPFILLLVGASSISLVSAESGENSLIPLRLLFPPNPLRWASAGALLSSDNRLICPKYAEGAPHTARGKPFPKRFQIILAQTPQRSLRGTAAGTHLPSPTGSHTAAYTAKHGAFRTGGGITTLGAFCAVRKPCAAGYQNGKLCRFRVLVGCAPEERGEPAGQRCVHARRCPEASRPRWAALPAAASCAASTISEVRYPCTEAQRKNYRLRHTSDCPASLACALLRAADSSNAQSC